MDQSEVWIVEDLSEHREILRAALIAAGIQERLIVEFEGYEPAMKAFENAIPEGKRRRAGSKRPLVLIADVGLGTDGMTGFTLLKNVAARATEAYDNIGFWTIVVTRLGADACPPDNRVPHLFIDKKEEEWARKAASAVAALAGDRLAADLTGNDLAPTKRVRPRDRIYLFSRGDAALANSGPGPGFEEEFPLGLIQPNLADLRREEAPILLYRGGFHVLKDQYLPRALLRIRCVALRRATDYGQFAPAEILFLDAKIVTSWEHGTDHPSRVSATTAFRADKGGVGVQDVTNQITRFRRTARQVTGLNEQQSRDLIPAGKIHGQLFVPKKEGDIGPSRLHPEWKNNLWTCPPDLRKGSASQGFLSRIHFVLSEEELEWHRKWREVWDGSDPAWKSFYDGSH